MVYIYYEMGQGKQDGLVIFYERNEAGILHYLACTPISDHQGRMQGIDRLVLEELTRRALEQSYRRKETVNFDIIGIKANELSVTGSSVYAPKKSR